jgi:hypothetical protein
METPHQKAERLRCEHDDLVRRAMEQHRADMEPFADAGRRAIEALRIIAK